MGIVHTMLCLSNDQVEGLLAAVSGALESEDLDALKQYLANQELLEPVEDEWGEIQIETTTTGLFRRKMSRQLTPPAPCIVEATLQLMGEQLPGDQRCDADKALSMLMDGHYKIDMGAVQGVEAWRDALDLGLVAPPEPLRMGDLPDYGFIPHEHCAALAQTTQQISDLCQRQDEYLTDALEDYRKLLQGCQEHQRIVVMQG